MGATSRGACLSFSEQASIVKLTLQRTADQAAWSCTRLQRQQEAQQTQDTNHTSWTDSNQMTLVDNYYIYKYIWYNSSNLNELKSANIP